MGTCPRCGTQIMGFENTCPTCGAPISLAQQPQPQPVPINPNAVAAVAQPVTVVNPAIMGQQPVQVGPGQMVGQQVVTAEQIEQNKKDAKKQKKQKVKENKEKQVDSNKQAGRGLNKEITSKQAAMVIFVLAIILIIVGVVMTITSSKSATAPNNNNNNTEKTTTQENPVTDNSTTTTNDENVDANRTLYAGYSFITPEGYQLEENNEYGLVFNNGEVAITIMIDASNNFDTYKSEFTTKFPGQADTLEKTVGDRNYIIINHLTPEQILKGTEYIAAANNNYSFVGLIIRKDGIEPDSSNYEVLNNILDTATSTDEVIKAGDDLDVGKLGTKIFNIDLTKFNF